MDRRRVVARFHTPRPTRQGRHGLDHGVEARLDPLESVPLIDMGGTLFGELMPEIVVGEHPRERGGHVGRVG